MKFRRAHDHQADLAPDPPAGRFQGMTPLTHDPDERQSSEDRDYGRSIFDAPVAAPRWLQPRSRRKRRANG